MITRGLITMATFMVRNVTQYSIARFLLGVAEAGFTPGVFLYLTGWVPAHWRAKALAAFLVGIPVSTVGGGPLASALLGMHQAGGLKGWQWLFLVEGGLAVVLGVMCLFILIDTPEKAPWLDSREKAVLTAALSREQSSIEAGHGTLTLGQALSNPSVLLLAFINFCSIVGLFGISFWLPQIMKGMALSTTAIGFVTAGVGVVGGIGMVLWARRSDRTGERVWHVSACCLLAGLGLAASSLFSAPLYALLALTLAVTGAYAFQATFQAIPPSFLIGRAAAGGIALIISTGNPGGFVGPYLVGWIRDATQSFSAPLLTLAAFPLLAAMLIPLFGRSVKLVAQPQ